MGSSSKRVGVWAVLVLAGLSPWQLGRVLATTPAAAGLPRATSLQRASPIQQTIAPGTPAGAEVRAQIDRYCVSCHGDRVKAAGLLLDKLDPSQVELNPEAWEKVVRKLRSEAMPPPGSRRPDKAGYEALTSWFETGLDRAAATNPNPGRPSVHRLNRAEYANAVRDLLGVVIDARAYLPADDSGYGFDNIADVLSISPGLLERYVVAGGKIGRLAVGDPTLRPTVVKYPVSSLFRQDGRASEDLPFGSRGGLAVQHQFPVDGEYIVKVRLQRTYTDIVRGMSRPHRVEIRLDRARLEEFTVGGAGMGIPVPSPAVVPQSQGNGRAQPDDGLEVHFTAKAGSHLIAAAFVGEPALEEGVFLPRPPLSSFEYAGKSDTDPAIDRIEVHGPYNATPPEDSPSRRKIFVCRPASVRAEEACAKTIVSTLARRAYRRPATDADVQMLMRLYATGRREGNSFDAGVEWAIERILVDPEFLYRLERPPVGGKPGTPYRLGDLELASRLSFFLWSSIPDDELLKVAAAGELKNSRILEQQVRRMLLDERSKALVANFAGQWLWQRNLRAHTPDPNLFSDYDDNLREAFQTETRLLLESQLRDDRPVVELLTANYTFVNERLARHYDMPNIYGSHFRRVQYPDDRRAGLLGQGSILTVTSYAHRTSPVKRGQWLLENLLGAPPPPPPPNVPALKENDEGAAPTSVRQRLEAHRKNPVCATCHARMDPLGFALENFDATGKWRTSGEGGGPIDASGTLPSGLTFNGPAQFRNALLVHSDQFAGTVVEKLLTYAVGRGVEYYDMPAVRAVMRDAAPEMRWSTLVVSIVKSMPFQMATVPQPEGVAVAVR